MSPAKVEFFIEQPQKISEEHNLDIKQNGDFSNKLFVSTSSLSSFNSTKRLIHSKSTESFLATSPISNRLRYVTVGILCCINLLNYVDRFSVAGVLKDIQSYYGIGDSESGLLHAVFALAFVAACPVFGYCGDRYNRKWLLVIGIMLWSCFTLAGSFVPKHLFWLFVVLRCLAGVGEATYATTAPAIIGDLFAKDHRSYMLMVFYFAIPVGSGVGQLLGAYMAEWFGGWQWALRVTPGLSVLCCLLMGILVDDPPRGLSEHGVLDHSTSTVKEDIKALVKNKTFLFVAAGNTCVTFTAGCINLFAPKFFFDAYRVQGNSIITEEQVSLYTGLCTSAAGFIGVAAGIQVGVRLKRIHKNGDTLVCAFGALGSIAFTYAAVLISQYNMTVTWVIMVIGQSLLSLNTAVAPDILLILVSGFFAIISLHPHIKYIVPAVHRSTSEAVEITFSHLLGDALGTYLIGLLSEELQANQTTLFQLYKSLQTALFFPLFIVCLGGGMYLSGSLFLVKDRQKAERETQGLPQIQTEATFVDADVMKTSL